MTDTDPEPPDDAGEAHAKRPAVTGQSDVDRAADSAPGEMVPGEDLKARQSQLLDEALEETFPGSDPISPHHII